jgi:hypothetical protein
MKPTQPCQYGQAEPEAINRTELEPSPKTNRAEAQIGLNRKNRSQLRRRWHVSHRASMAPQLSDSRRGSEQRWPVKKVLNGSGPVEEVLGGGGSWSKQNLTAHVKPSKQGLATRQPKPAEEKTRRWQLEAQYMV